MNRRALFLSLVLTVGLVLGTQLGAPRIAQADAGIFVIDTTPSWNGTQLISSFGTPNTATYGQVITAPSGTSSGIVLLTKFSFFIRLPTSVAFRGFVFKWDGSKAVSAALSAPAVANTAGQPSSPSAGLAVGTPVFESSPRTTTQGANFEEVVFNIPNGVQLNSGQLYVLFASTSKESNPNGVGQWGAVTNTAYPGGQFVFINNGTNPSQWTSAIWSTIAIDLAFRATFYDPAPAEVPEADTLLLVGGGMGGLATWLAWQWSRLKPRRNRNKYL